MTVIAPLEADAKNRALRTFLQGLAIDIAVAVSLVLYNATSSDEVSWQLIPLSLARSVIQTAAAYVMRRFVDPSFIPTPLPPIVTAPTYDSEPLED